MLITPKLPGPNTSSAADADSGTRPIMILANDGGFRAGIGRKKLGAKARDIAKPGDPLDARRSGCAKAERIMAATLEGEAAGGVRNSPKPYWSR